MNERSENVLAMFAEAQLGPLTPDEVETMYGLPVPATLASLAAQGHLRRTPSGCYELTAEGADFVRGQQRR